MRRLRAGLALALLVLPAAAAARSSPATVLLSATIAPEAATAIAPGAWAQIVTRYINSDKVVPAAGAAGVSECRKAGALYIVLAEFGLQSDAAHSTRPDGRIAGRAHVRSVNCVSGATVADRIVDFLSSVPPDNGDLEPSSAALWDDAALAALRRTPLPSSYVARIKSYHPPQALVDLPFDLPPGLTDLRVFAHGDGTPFGPVNLHITDVTTRGVVVLVPQEGPQPQVGDYVEPILDADSAASATRPH